MKESLSSKQNIKRHHQNPNTLALLKTERLNLSETGSWSVFEPMEIPLKLRAEKDDRTEFISCKQGLNLRSTEVKATY